MLPMRGLNDGSESLSLSPRFLLSHYVHLSICPSVHGVSALCRRRSDIFFLLCASFIVQLFTHFTLFSVFIFLTRKQGPSPRLSLSLLLTLDSPIEWTKNEESNGPICGKREEEREERGKRGQRAKGTALCRRRQNGESVAMRITMSDVEGKVLGRGCEAFDKWTNRRADPLEMESPSQVMSSVFSRVSTWHGTTGVPTYNTWASYSFCVSRQLKNARMANAYCAYSVAHFSLFSSFSFLFDSQLPFIRSHHTFPPSWLTLHGALCLSFCLLSGVK